MSCASFWEVITGDKSAPVVALRDDYFAQLVYRDVLRHPDEHPPHVQKEARSNYNEAKVKDLEIQYKKLLVKLAIEHRVTLHKGVPIGYSSLDNQGKYYVDPTHLRTDTCGPTHLVECPHFTTVPIAKQYIDSTLDDLQYEKDEYEDAMEELGESTRS